VSRETALLTFGIGPVHSFIAQARRVADVWAGSRLLSDLVQQAVYVLWEAGGEMVFPHLEAGDIPEGLPNRFVGRVPAARANEIAMRMEEAIRERWSALARRAVVEVLSPLGLAPAAALWTESPAPGRLRQTDALLDFAWSWVAETEGYARASIEGAARFAAVRVFRPFPQIAAEWEKCAICGERTALPSGIRENVQSAWRQAEAKAEGPQKKYFRFDQGRLCLVCATKRLYTYLEGFADRFLALDRFQPSDTEPYLALVKMDGDRMGGILSLPQEAVRNGDLEAFHRAVSRALLGFADGLRKPGSVDLNVAALGYEARGEGPQLIYAGGDDVLFVCDPRDALPLVQRLRTRYVAAFEEARSLLVDPDDRERFTISAAVLFAHSSHPAGLLLRDLEEILEVEAKAGAGRNAAALRLAKRGGAPEEVAFSWRDANAPEGDWLGSLDRITEWLRQGRISSHQTFTLRLEERTLLEVFDKSSERWRAWLADRLSRNEVAAGDAGDIAGAIAPFFLHDHAAALRIARFLGREAER
jgi:CRISPR-associated protein Cmr2